MYAKGIISRKKVPAAAGIRTNSFLFESQVLYHLQRNAVQVFSTPSPSTHFREQTEARVNLW